jgi:hypothetical protein
MPRGVKKENLPTKICVVGGRPCVRCSKLSAREKLLTPFANYLLFVQVELRSKKDILKIIVLEYNVARMIIIR